MAVCYLAMRTDLYVATESETRRSLGGKQLACVTAHSNDPETVFVGTVENGLQRSTDGGQTFDRIGTTSIEQDAVTAVAIDTTDHNRIWAGTEPSRVYRSVDGGDSWNECRTPTTLASAERWSFPPRPHTHHVRWIEPHPTNEDHLYVGIEAGALIQTHDGGETWHDRVPDSRIDNHTLTTHPRAPDRVWSAAGDGYAESTDAGEAWTHPQEGLEHRYCWSVAVDPGEPRTVLLSAADGARTAHAADRADSYIYRKQHAEPWERLDGTGIPMGDGVVRAVLTSGTTVGELFAATNYGLYRTADGGDRWDPVCETWPDAFETQTPQGLAVV
ncbi:hypothetical protein HUB97_04925 [Halorubraceae archaeon YAN]|nr:hypothetical protein [Halorubraceae archaeon YAN]